MIPKEAGGKAGAEEKVGDITTPIRSPKSNLNKSLIVFHDVCG
jgi:hypothetical protein